IFMSYTLQEHYGPHTMPGLTFASGLISHALEGRDEHADLGTLLATVSPQNCQPLPFTYPVATDWHFYYRLAARGLLSWMSTKPTEEEYAEYVTDRYGATAALIDHVEWVTPEG